MLNLVVHKVITGPKGPLLWWEFGEFLGEEATFTYLNRSRKCHVLNNRKVQYIVFNIPIFDCILIQLKAKNPVSVRLNTSTDIPCI